MTYLYKTELRQSDYFVLMPRKISQFRYAARLDCRAIQCQNESFERLQLFWTHH